MKNHFGYDLICFDDRIEFAMELCQKNKPIEEEELEDEEKRVIFEEMERDLKENLKTLHSLKIMHRDIK